MSSQIFTNIAEHKWFKNFIIAMIILAGILVGFQTSKSTIHAYKSIFDFLDSLVLWIFTIEVIIKVLAEGRKPWNYFKDPWNIFDFSIVALSLMEPLLPMDTSFLPILRLFRLFRVLRVLRIVTVIPELKLLVETLLKSVSSIIYVGMFLLLIFYIFGTMAVIIFGDNDPRHFGSLPLAILTLYRVVTLEDWTDVMYINMYGCDKYGYDGHPEECVAPYALPVGAALYFVTFVSIGTMIILNLFIGVIMNSMDQANAEKELHDVAERRKNENVTISDEIYLIHDKLEEITKQLDLISHRVENEFEQE